MSGHTPGPWRTTDRDGFTRTATEVVDAGGSHVAATAGRNASDAECEANAHLIAAAPDLLEACRMVDGELSDPRLLAVAIPRMREALAAAIAKATGGTP